MSRWQTTRSGCVCSQDRSCEREERGFVFILHQESMHAFFTVVKDPSSNVRSTVGVSIYLSSANASVIGGGKGPFLPPKSANCMHGHSHQKKKKGGHKSNEQWHGVAGRISQNLSSHRRERERRDPVISSVRSAVSLMATTFLTTFIPSPLPDGLRFGRTWQRSRVGCVSEM